MGAVFDDAGDVLFAGAHDVRVCGVLLSAGVAGAVLGAAVGVAVDPSGVVWSAVSVGAVRAGYPSGHQTRVAFSAVSSGYERAVACVDVKVDLLCAGRRGAGALWGAAALGPLLALVRVVRIALR